MAVKCKNETKIFMEYILYYYECLIKRLTYEMYSSIERIKVLKVQYLREHNRPIQKPTFVSYVEKKNK